MALALQNGIQVWQKVEKALTNANPGAQEAFRGLKKWLTTQKGNPQLQFIPFTAALLVADTGYSPIAVPATVYAIYAKNTGSGGTDSYIRVYNSATNTTNTAAFITGVIQVAGDDFYAMKSNGWAFGTDVTISADTGTDATESAAADAADGFILVGAA